MTGPDPALRGQAWQRLHSRVSSLREDHLVRRNAPPFSPLIPAGHTLRTHLLIIAVADLLVEAVESFHVAIVKIVRGQVGTPSEPPFSRHLGRETPPPKKQKIFFVENIFIKPLLIYR